jgi:hypothetical protein
MKYKRFFAFGCSLTNYYWPTWADIIGKEMPLYENWGGPGFGNHYIFNSIIEADIKHNFNQEDLIIVMWSGIHREDRYKNNNWQRFNKQLPTETWKDLYDERGFLIRDLGYITAIKELLKKTNYKFTAMNVFWYSDNYKSEEFKIASKSIWNGLPFDKTQVKDSDVIDYYKNTLKIFYPSICETVFDFDWNNTRFKKKFDDLHPTPLEHLEFITKTWKDLQISEKTIKWIIKNQEQVLNLTKVETNNINLIKRL